MSPLLVKPTLIRWSGIRVHMCPNKWTHARVFKNQDLFFVSVMKKA